VLLIDTGFVQIEKTVPDTAETQDEGVTRKTPPDTALFLLL
jgi:hypothetical protein